MTAWHQHILTVIRRQLQADRLTDACRYNDRHDRGIAKLPKIVLLLLYVYECDLICEYELKLLHVPVYGRVHYLWNCFRQPQPYPNFLAATMWYNRLSHFSKSTEIWERLHDIKCRWCDQANRAVFSPLDWEELLEIIPMQSCVRGLFAGRQTDISVPGGNALGTQPLTCNAPSRVKLL